MADMIDKEFAALMDSRGEDTSTEQEEAASNVEQQQQQFEQSAAQPDQQQQQDKPAEAAQGAADPAKQDEQKAAEPKKDELPLDEIKKRWEDQKGATAKERQERRAAIARAEAAEQRASQIEAQFRQVIAELQQKANKAPDPEEDVVGALKATQAQLAQFQQMEMARREQAARIAQQNRYVQKVTSAVEDFETEFKAEHADYDDALDYVLDLKEHEFSVVGYSPEQAKQAAANWAMNAANLMLRQGRNPAQAGYEMAQKLGFKPKAAPAANGAAAQPDPAAEAQTKAAQEAAAKLQQIKDGQAAGSKMSGGGSGSGFDGSLKSIAQLEGAAFDAASEKFLRQMTRG